MAPSRSDWVPLGYPNTATQTHIHPDKDLVTRKHKIQRKSELKVACTHASPAQPFRHRAWNTDSPAAGCWPGEMDEGAAGRGVCVSVAFVKLLPTASWSQKSKKD